MTTKLELFNGALLAADTALLGSLSEERESRRILDTIWANGAVDYCLRLGFWKFSLRSVKLEIEPDVSISFGYSGAFNIPDDYNRTYMLCSDGYFRSPLMRYQIERGYIFADETEIFLRYVSDTIGADMSEWPADFLQVVIHYMALRAAPSLKNGAKMADVKALFDDALSKAKSADAMENPPTFKPEGSWNRSRRSRAGQTNRYE